VRSNAKRVATIKSKTYPQLKKKTLAKLDVDPSDGERREEERVSAKRQNADRIGDDFTKEIGG
jgi:U3 small nucleolar RNA-associated protein 14